MKTNHINAYLKKGIKVLGWVAMALVLAFTAAIICTVKVLNPERLTPLMNRIANNTLNADVHIGRAELAFRPAFPVFEVKVDTLCLISKSFRNIDNA